MRKELAYFACAALIIGCNGESARGTDTGGGVTGGTGAGGSAGGTGARNGSIVTTTAPAARAEETAAITRALSEFTDLDATTLLKRFPTSFEPAP
ncbi:MAG TPA: hypothetical protein VMS65_14795, partial [Polyangiaceae bacterium]|nr:hypothetical protein [Polyangiaceae bacterium]